jgi:hypothetical protein
VLDRNQFYRNQFSQLRPQQAPGIDTAIQGGGPVRSGPPGPPQPNRLSPPGGGAPPMGGGPMRSTQGGGK